MVISLESQTSVPGHLRDVELGHRNESEAEIQDGLSEGDRVIVHPPSELRAGGPSPIRKTPD